MEVIPFLEYLHEHRCAEQPADLMQTLESPRATPDEQTLLT